MESRHFDDLVRGLALPRRALLAGALALASSQLDLASGAGKKRKRRKPKSGICEGKKGKKRCRSHDTGGCQPGAEPQECSGEEMDVVCTTSAGKQGICGTTTGNAGYCLATGTCFDCRTDADCKAALGGQFGPQLACVRCADCDEFGGTICATPDFFS